MNWSRRYADSAIWRTIRKVDNAKIRFRRVAVLMGGVSSEREVSLDSGRNVADALEKAGIPEVARVELKTESLDAMPAGVDAAFVALHGGWGENGGVQAALEARAIPYTGPGPAACALAMDKTAAKKILEAACIPTAEWVELDGPADEPPLPLPVVVKPPCDGSSVGISKVSEPGEWSRSFQAARNADPHGRVLVERYLPGREWTVGVLDGEPLPVLEILAPGGWYGWEAKYLTCETRYVFPEDDPSVPSEALAEARRLAAAACAAAGCEGVSRVDFRLDASGAPFVLEINTSPGMTSHSLLPKAAARAGMDFPALCARILAGARCGKGGAQ